MSETYDEPATTKGNNKSYTANPRREQGEDTYESTGPITSDSLAKESINSGGGYSDNRNPEVYDVSGANSTFTNTDTTNARRMNPADNREDRDGDRFSSTKYPSDGDDVTSSGGNQGYGSRNTSSYNDDTTSSGNQGYGGQNTSSYDDDSGNNYSSSGRDADTGPTYASTTQGSNFSSGTYQPKGDNLNEDDPDIPPNRSTYTGDVGGPKDPGRLAEQKFARDNAISGADAGYQRDTGEVSDGTKYDALNSSERT